MSRFNKKINIRTYPQTALSANGNEQAVKSAEQELYELMVTFLVGNDGYYSSSNEKQARLSELINSLVAANRCDFIANLLVHARKQMHIRNAPILGYVAFVKALRDNNVKFNGLRALTSDVIGRVDQITDVLALSLETFGGKQSMPMALKRGLSDAFNAFGEYAFAKYNRKGAVTFKDALRIVHPIPSSPEKGELFNRIITDTLETPKTWETVLSSNGQKAAADQLTKQAMWEDLITSKSLGYQATLKNLRNILEADVSKEHLELLASYLKDNVLKSKTLPFEFLAAYDAIEHFPSQTLKNAISDCIDLSVSNLPEMGNTWVILDVSASMKMCSAGSQAAFLAACLIKVCEGSDKFQLTLFDNSARHVSVNGRSPVLSSYQQLKSGMTGGSTNYWAALNLGAGFTPDSVFVLTDGEINGFNPSAQFYGYRGSDSINDSEKTKLLAKAKGRKLSVALNMEARPTTPLAPQEGWQVLSGWSPKIFEYCSALAEGQGMLQMLNKPYKAS